MIHVFSTKHSACRYGADVTQDTLSLADLCLSQDAIRNSRLIAYKDPDADGLNYVVLKNRQYGVTGRVDKETLNKFFFDNTYLEA